ncbi:MAG: TIGR02536 family ethanolamine utilization protein [Clostridium sp.]|uniref:TIGR02536 family ethanolamine utilization protein n=1 Tax=Clostridium sp. TaxID=1506 RepID=UPI003F2F4C42
MDYNQLIKVLVDEIYLKINSKEPIKERMIVIGNRECEKLKEFEEKYSVVKYEANMEMAEALFLTNLSIRELSNLSLGMASSEIEEYILKYIMSGRDVYVLSDGMEYKEYKKTAPKLLYRKYVEDEESLVSYGVKLINHSTEIEKEKNYTTEKASSEEKQITLTKKLISESDLRKPYINGVRDIIINKKTIITPLAKDYIRINNINIKFS